MNWFQRHLDTTLFLFFLCWVLAMAFILSLLSELDLNSQWRDTAGIYGIVLICVVTGWYLQQKKRSIAWLLLLPVPLGIVGILWLGDKSET